MYRQWCKNLKNFINYNKEQSGTRLQMAEELLVLTDIETYKMHKENNSSVYRETNAFINGLKQYQNEYPSIRKFIWELWGYGFETGDEVEDKIDDTMLEEEKVKLIDLLYGTHYM